MVLSVNAAAAVVHPVKEIRVSRVSKGNVIIFLSPPGAFTKKRRVEEIIFSDPACVDPIPPEFMSHKAMYENELRKSVHFLQKFLEDERLQEMAGGLEGISLIFVLKYNVNDGDAKNIQSNIFV
ncbi:unnamed protein product, partial [Meganyctiphanes norvegica]